MSVLLPDGTTKTLTVNEVVGLESIQVGETVTLMVTEGMAVQVDDPENQ